MTRLRHISVSCLDANKLTATKLNVIMQKAFDMEVMLAETTCNCEQIDLAFVTFTNITDEQKQEFRAFVRSLLA